MGGGGGGGGWSELGRVLNEAGGVVRGEGKGGGGKGKWVLRGAFDGGLRKGKGKGKRRRRRGARCKGTKVEDLRISVSVRLKGRSGILRRQRSLLRLEKYRTQKWSNLPPPKKKARKPRRQNPTTRPQRQQ